MGGVVTPRGAVARTESVPGALVIGGDYQGLGIVRSLGRRGIPVVVVDDERSISRHSRYVQGAYQFSELRDDADMLDALRGLARSGRYDGWVVYPTREETVATLSRHRAELSEHFRIPTPEWSVTGWAWDKRNTYRRAQRARNPHAPSLERRQRGRTARDRRRAAVRHQAGDQGALLLRHRMQGVASRQP